MRTTSGLKTVTPPSSPNIQTMIAALSTTRDLRRSTSSGSQPSSRSNSRTQGRKEVTRSLMKVERVTGITLNILLQNLMPELARSLTAASCQRYPRANRAWTPPFSQDLDLRRNCLPFLSTRLNSLSELKRRCRKMKSSTRTQSKTASRRSR